MGHIAQLRKVPIKDDNLYSDRQVEYSEALVER